MFSPMADGSTQSDDAMRQLGIVLADLSRSLDRHMDRDFPHPRPPETHLAVLRLVRANDGMTVRELGDALFMQSSNASAVVSQLLTQGLISKERDTDDRRVFHLHLSAEARARVDEADAQVGRYLINALAQLDVDAADVIRRAVPALAALRQAIS